MNTLYIQCNMGCAGDMLLSALSELLINKADFFQKLNNMGLKGVIYESKPDEKCGITGTLTDVIINGVVEESGEIHHHSHNNMNTITEIIEKLNIPEKVKNDALNVYEIIAEAESKVHNKSVDMIHFHEIGNMDAIADIVGVCYIIYELNPDKIYCSDINVGSGSVKCAHGILPVPAPATAIILNNMPVYNNQIKGELCTPTGAALLKYFVNEFKPMPVMKIEKTAYGMGHKDFETANCVRIISGNIEDNIIDKIVKLECNIDDMTGEDIAFAEEMVFSAGAREVYTSPVYMKKNRPGVIFTCICTESDKNRIAETIFKHTSTIGIRESVLNRYILERKIAEKETKLGTVQIKKSYGYGYKKEKVEFEDIAKLARENNLSLNQVRKIIGESE